MSLNSIKYWIKNCGGCGLCTGPGPVYPFREGGVVPEKEGVPSHTCPIYEKYKFASTSPRGLLYLAAAVAHRDVPITVDLVDRAYQCLTCGVCDDICYINKIQAIHGLRSEIVERGMGPQPANQRVDDQIKKTNNYFGMPSKDRNRWAEDLNLTPEGDLLFFTGCFGSYLYQQEARAVVHILSNAGLRIAHMGLKEICCGAHPYWDGNVELAKTKAKSLIGSIEKTGIKEVIVSCADCYYMFREAYEVLFGGLPFKVTHISEKISDLLREGQLKPRREIKKTVTYHDPCRLFNFFMIGDEVRTVIKSLPGIKYKEMRDGARWSACCGSGGMVVQEAFPGFCEEMAVSRLNHAKSLASELITNCPHCFDVFTKSAKKYEIGINILPLVGLVSSSLE
jgi:heterodisulfide reductase subunit D